MPASTTFIATIGHTPTNALKKTRMTQAMVLSTRRRRMRAWSSEKTSRADPNQPSASTQLTGWSSPNRTVTEAVTVDSPASTGIPPPTSMAACAANRGRGMARSRSSVTRSTGPSGRPGERGELLGLGAGVLEGRGPGPLEQGRRVGHLERDVVEAEGVAGGPGERPDEVADALAVAHEEPHALVRGVADDRAALPVPPGRDAHAGRAAVPLGDAVVGRRPERGGDAVGRRGQRPGDVGGLALDAGVEDDDVGDGARGARAGHFHVVRHARHRSGR